MILNLQMVDGILEVNRGKRFMFKKGAEEGYQALRKYGFEAKDITIILKNLADDKVYR